MMLSLHFQSYQKMNLSFFLFGEDSAALSNDLKKIYWSTTIIAGGSIVDLANYQMHYFLFKVMRQDFEGRLLFSDADRLFYSVKWSDFYSEPSKKPQAVLYC